MNPLRIRALQQRPKPLPLLSLLMPLALMLGAAPGAHAADALNGKSLYLNGPTSGGTSCAACHGPTPANNVNGILAAANNPSVISAAFASNRGGMGALFNGKFSAAEIEDLAAFIGNPNVVAAPAASFAPASLSFGGVTVGQNSAALSTTLSNTGNAVLNVSGISVGGAHGGDFSISGGSCSAGGTLAAGANCTIQLIFRPAAGGARSAALNVGHNAAGGSSSVPLGGTGNAVPQATVSLSANAIDFGPLLVGTASALQTLSVTNSGQAALNFSGIGVSGASAGIFTLGGTCSTSAPVAAGGSCTITLQATAAAAGAVSAALNLASNASNGNVAVGLAGNASAAAPLLAANPAAVAFGTQTVGATPVTQNVEVANRGNVPVAFTGITVNGAPSVTIGSGACSGTLAVGAACNVPLVFTPAAEGNIAATLLLRSNAPELSVAISGAGTTAAVARPELSDTGPVPFADTQVGQQAAAHRTTLRNTGNAALTIATLVLGGTHPGDFALAGSCAVGATVSPGANCSIDSVFKPTAAGARTADLVLTTNGGAQFSVRLNGNGVGVPSTAPILNVNPQSFDFGPATIGATPAVKRFVLTNGGSAALVLNSAAFSGPFALASGSNACGAFPLTLAPGASCELPVQFNPASVGSASGNATLAATGGSWTIALSGQGASAPAGGGATQNRGGGGCSAAQGGSDPMLAILALLATAVLLWRRRSATPAAVARPRHVPMPVPVQMPVQLPMPAQMPVQLPMPAHRHARAVAPTQFPAVAPAAAAAAAEATSAAVAAAATAAATLSDRAAAAAAAPRDAAIVPTLLLATAWLAVVAALAFTTPASALEPGKPAPSFALSGPAGPVKLEQYQGKLVYLDFWASWCGPCRQSFPWMNDMQAKYGAQGLQIVGINVDAKPEDARSFLAATPASFVIAYDASGASPRSYGIKGMPSSVLIGPDGRVLYEHSGFRPADKEALEAKIKSALGGAK